MSKAVHDTDSLWEEESLPGYEHEEFYPVKIGAVLADRYAVLGKLGFGANSTVWLCRDLKSKTVVAVKVYISTTNEAIYRERVAYQHLSRIDWTKNAGARHVRQILDSFELKRSDGKASHICLVHEPLHISLFSFQRMSGKVRPFPEVLAKSITKYLLSALHFLHADADVTHCDIKRSNIMLQIEDTSVLDDFEAIEQLRPSPQKIIDADRSIYASRSLKWPKGHAFGSPVLCDLGEARIGPQPYAEIQPEIYKAPEILMQFGWSHSADIWNLACVIWEMVETTHLFDGYDEEKFHNNRVHLWEIVCLLGLPPQEFLARSEQSWRLFDNHGQWKASPPVSPRPLQDRAQTLEVDSKAQFVDFMLCMLRWLPEDRWTAEALLQHSWIKDI